MSPDATCIPRRKAAHLLTAAITLLSLAGCSTGNLKDAWEQTRKIPGMVNKMHLPALDDLLNQQPVTTSFDDAVTEAPFLDGFSPPQEAFQPLSWLSRNAEGAFLMVPGLYFVEAESYCIHAGTYGPSKGDGYLYAPLKGPRADIVQSVLRRSAQRPEIDQREIQLLLWAIIARTRLSDMPMERRRTALELLTAKELFELNGGALGLIPPATMQSWMAKVPPEVQEIYEAERKLRELFTTRVDARFEEIERLAVLAGVAPAADLIRAVPRGRWSYHPRGFFLRFFPSSYSRTRQEIYVPRPFNIERDDWGRITALDDGRLIRVETTYRSAADRPEGSTEGLLAYRFRTLRLQVRASRIHPGAPDKTLEKNDKGWVFLESRTPAPEKPANLLAWPVRRQSSLDARKLLTSSPSGEAAGAVSFREVLDVIHYSSAIEMALAPPGAKNPEWVSAAVKAVSRAPHSALLSDFAARHAANASRTRPTAFKSSPQPPPSTVPLPVVYDPTESIATPANRSSQRLISGGIPSGNEKPLWFKTLPDCPCHWNDGRWDGRRDEKMGRQGTWDAGTPFQRYHPKAVYELRWLPDDNLSGQQCTYDGEGKLITKGLGAGTPDLLTPTAANFYWWFHGDLDIVTWEKLPCANYLLMWPPNNGNLCAENEVTPIPTGRAERESCSAIRDSLRP